jgi:hypothetical protein
MQHERDAGSGQAGRERGADAAPRSGDENPAAHALILQRPASRVKQLEEGRYRAPVTVERTTRLDRRRNSNELVCANIQTLAVQAWSPAARFRA